MTDEPMPQATRDALLGSIEKWRAIVAGTDADYGSGNCPLCDMFIDRRCDGCPVDAAVGRAGCSGTPYEAFVKAESAAGRSSKPLGPPGGDPLVEAARDRAREELAFLEGLLPEADR